MRQNRQMTRWVPLAFVAALSWCATPGFATEPARPLSFVNDVMPILTKASCNSGGCHAKAGNGQNGFRLSLLGFEPQEDYEHIVKEGHGRRVFPAAPEQSLLLLKASNVVPHGGGKRLDPSSEGYTQLARWISEGMAYGKETDPKLVSIEVQPKRNVMKLQGEQQLKVLAHYSDDHTADVTRMALYEPNDKGMAEADENGLVKLLDVPGNVAVMVRYQGMVSVYIASIPLGAPVVQMPAEKNFIDTLIFANLKQVGVPPSPVCDDATFLRRVALDIAGRVPTLEEAREFLSSHDADKRDRLIESSLSSPDYADYFANKWTAILRNRRDDTSDITANFAFHSWVRDGLLANKPYDQMVRELLAATGTIADNPAVAWYKRVLEPQQQLEDVAQLFLGVRMQCAQCHHHPFERWSQNDYFSLGAFFSRVGRKPTSTRGESLIFHQRGTAQLENKKTKIPVMPATLGGPTLAIPQDEDPRLKLADWMSDKANPYFAKSLVNRYWKHFFKRGLIEPEDDIRETNPATNPELLDALANQFVASGYDLKAVVRVITQSHTYQLSALPNAYNGVDRQNFSHYYPKRMQAEVLLDALDQLTGAKTDFANLPPGTRAISLPDNSYNRSSPFLKVFGRPEGASVCECERVQSPSLAQSLHLMNAADVKAKLSTPNGRADLLAKSNQAESEKVRELYLAAYSREPSVAELKVTEAYVARPRVDAQGKPLDPARAKREAYEDLLWAIINTKEYLYNH
ncbi:Protein of unknown function [Singulisphaera sp. GP187]|uniref:DUF1549 and DUF1553 domain-containing protein n=1 Tax=Singulisphaera sp. GP187 TaxID=1882752 RepID=UPI000927BC42|nr:DUF1549 and DUF1553 domain-containing protein [Singulisphaera sp. GP187]SIN79570.1 Protein of unknown function [Singulisphaera sp. GP187]